MSMNGAVVRLEAGDYAATVVASGAALAALTYQGRPLILGFDAERELGPGYLGRVVAPWPNRITEGRYSFGGVDYELPLTEHARRAALHGLVSYVPWSIQARSDTEVVFGYSLPGHPAYPFPLCLRTRYALGADGLTVEVSAHNSGEVAAPVGLTTHPYLTAGPLDECTLEVPAAQVLLVDEQMAPTELRPVDEAGFDLRSAPTLAGRRIDHAFTGLPDRWTVELRGPEGGVRLSAEEPWCQVFTGDAPGIDRRGVAVEAMTCGPDAFNREDVTLAPGETRRLRLTIAAS